MFNEENILRVQELINRLEEKQTLFDDDSRNFIVDFACRTNNFSMVEKLADDIAMAGALSTEMKQQAYGELIKDMEQLHELKTLFGDTASLDEISAEIAELKEKTEALQSSIENMNEKEFNSTSQAIDTTENTYKLNEKESTTYTVIAQHGTDTLLRRQLGNAAIKDPTPYIIANHIETQENIISWHSGRYFSSREQAVGTFEAERIVSEFEKLSEPNSPHRTHYMVPLSPYFLMNAGSRDYDILEKNIAKVSGYKTTYLSSLKDEKGVYVFVNRKEIESEKKMNLSDRLKAAGEKLSKGKKADIQPSKQQEAKKEGTSL